MAHPSRLLGLLPLLAATTLALGSAPAPGAEPCPGADDPLPTTHDAAVAALPAIRETIACLVNRERTSRGLRAWRRDERLDNAAQARANDMVERWYFAHESPDGRGAAVEVRGQGYAFAELAEDLVKGFDTPATTVRAFMTSWTHCSTVLDPRLTQAGTGVAFGHPMSPDDGRGLVLYAAELAARPAGTRAPRGSQRPRQRCPYWRVTPTATGWLWELLSGAQSARVRAAQRG